MPDNRKILVAEDDAGVRELIRTHLRMAGYDVHVARTGVEALSGVRLLEPIALILDINMPELDGFGVLEALHRNAVRVPVLVMTARHAEEDVHRAVSLGAKDYLTKPFSEGQLLARVIRLLRQPLTQRATGNTLVLNA
jgi:two-component system OmpR family response regulator